MKNLPLKYAVEYLIQHTNRDGNQHLRCSNINKFLFILEMRLKESHIDLNLPYSWYLHGTMVESSSFEKMVGVLWSFYEPEDDINFYGTTITLDVRECSSEYYVSTPALSGAFNNSTEFPQTEPYLTVQKEIDALLGSYSSHGKFNPGYEQGLMKDCYEYAPFEFQRIYMMQFLPLIEKIISSTSYDETNSPLVEEERKEVEASLDSLVEIFPEEISKELFDLFLEYDDTMRLAITRDRSVLKTLVNDFLKVFASYLSIHHHEHIREDKIEEWKQQYPCVLEDYKKKLGEIRRKLLLKPDDETLQSVQKTGEQIIGLTRSIIADEKGIGWN
jgi:hypothetical protein